MEQLLHYSQYMNINSIKLKTPLIFLFVCFVFLHVPYMMVSMSSGKLFCSYWYTAISLCVIAEMSRRIHFSYLFRPVSKQKYIHYCIQGNDHYPVVSLYNISCLQMYRAGKCKWRSLGRINTQSTYLQDPFLNPVVSKLFHNDQCYKKIYVQ